MSWTVVNDIRYTTYCIRTKIMKKNVTLISLGCPKNLVDSERVLGYLESQGFNIVPDMKKAHIVFINTCSFIKDARKESKKVILQCLGWKKKNPKYRKVVVFGCLPQLKGEKTLRDLTDIDELMGVEPFNYKGRLLSQSPHSVYLKIAEGCDRSCTFCIIPKIRGNYRSCQPKDIIEEARALEKLGTKELIIIAEDTTFYGRDLKCKTNLVKLIRKLVRIDGIEWIRLMYLYPDSVDDDLIELIATEDKVCKYVDMPLQHINTRIIKKMKRGMGKKGIINLIKKMRKRIKNLSIRTAFIVGFPGESDVEFKELLDFIDQIKFDHVGFFAYSNEEEAISSKFEGQISIQVKKARLKMAYQRQRIVSREKNKKMVGRYVKILVDGPGRGRTQNSAPEIDSLVYFDAKEEVMPGDFACVKINSSSDYHFNGVLVK